MENYKQVRKFQAMIVSCMLFFVVVVGVAIVSFVSLGKARRQNARYDDLIASLKQEEASLREGIAHVSDPDYLEERARNELGMIKEGETLYIFDK